MIRKVLMGTVALLGLSGAAMAADLPVKAIQQAAALGGIANWQGLYFDAYFAYGADLTGTNLVMPGGTVIDLSSVSHGPGLGGSIGYNIDAGGLVFGARADLSWLNLSNGTGNVTMAGVNPLSASAATNYLGNVDALIGLPCSPDRKLLCYGVGGFAFGGTKAGLAGAPSIFAPGGFNAAVSNTSVGWNLGAGLRYQLTPNLHVFIEGDYYQLGDKQVSINDPNTGLPILTNTAHFNILEQKGGISLKF